MSELRDEVFAAHDRIGSPPLTPPKPPQRRFHAGWFVYDLFFVVLKGPVILLVVLTGAGFAWFAYIAVIAAVIVVMVSTGYAVGWLFGF